MREVDQPLAFTKYGFTDDVKTDDPVYIKLHKVSKLKSIKIDMLAKKHEEVFVYKPSLNKNNSVVDSFEDRLDYYSQLREKHLIE